MYYWWHWNKNHYLRVSSSKLTFGSDKCKAHDEMVNGFQFTMKFIYIRILFILLIDQMTPTAEKTICSIPVSAFPPVSLERPLKLFGGSFNVHISTGLTLCPNTLLQIVSGRSLLQFMREHKTRTDHSLRALFRAATGRNKPSETTRKLIKQMLGKQFPSEDLDEVLEGREPTFTRPWQSDWAVIQQTIDEPGDDDLYQLVARYANLDRIAWSVRQLYDNGSPSDGMALLALHIGYPVESWRQLNPNLILPVAFLVDVSLQTLAWLEWRSILKHPADCATAHASQLMPLLVQGKKPIGHWLLRMQESAKCTNLREFSAFMVSKGIKRHNYFVSHELLKKWSSGQQLMPVKASECVLNAVGGRLDAEQEKRRFAVARCLSFLCDLLISGTRGGSPLWSDVQDQILRRYNELYEIEGFRS